VTKLLCVACQVPAQIVMVILGSLYDTALGSTLFFIVLPRLLQQSLLRTLSRIPSRLVYVIVPRRLPMRWRPWYPQPPTRPALYYRVSL